MHAHRSIEAGGAKVDVREQTGALSGTGGGIVVWYWYRVGGVRAVETIEAKLLRLYGFLRGRHDSMVVAVAAVHNGDEEGARGRLERFLPRFVERLGAGT